MVDFHFAFTSDPHSGLEVPEGTPESQLLTENDEPTFDITSALLPFRVPERSDTGSQRFVITSSHPPDTSVLSNVLDGSGHGTNIHRPGVVITRMGGTCLSNVRRPLCAACPSS